MIRTEKMEKSMKNMALDHKYKVCILTSGKGTRMGSYSETINKALLPVNGKAIISRIIDHFHKDTRFVISLGYLGNQVKDFLKLSYPEKFFEYVWVSNFEGPHSGPGRSLYDCKKKLNLPFFFVACDSIYDDFPIKFKKNNWVGVKNVPINYSKDYCNIKSVNGLAVEVIDKKLVKSKQFKAFTGICYIYDHKLFWEGLKNDLNNKFEIQITSGLKYLIDKKKLNSKELNWFDVGTESKYKSENLKYSNFDFSKVNEFIYTGKKIVKFFKDPEITKQRYLKGKYKIDSFPNNLKLKNQFFSYDFYPGSTLYQKNSREIFNRLLIWLKKEFWIPANVSKKNIHKSCKIFYIEKTKIRLKLFEEKYGKSQPKIINGFKVPNSNELVSKIPLDFLINGEPYFIHGDLQFDNIIYNPSKKKFKLIDWRQDFAGNLSYGDIYYDLAKLYGGINLNYDHIKKNLMSYTENKSSISFDYLEKNLHKYLIVDFEKFIIENNFNLLKVKIIASLIYLNMAPLHHYPFDKLLHALGRLKLNNLIESNIIN